MKGHSYGFLLFLIIAVVPIKTAAQQMEIDFNDPAGLLGIPGVCSRTNSLCSGAPFEFANFYREKGMVFTDSVNPPDPALRSLRWEHYHLSYANPLVFLLPDPKTGALAPFKLFLSPLPMLLPLTHPENEKRILAPHLPGAVIQMIYDPNNDGVPHPFNLISLEVFKGKLNVGTKSPTTGISVYNNLTAPSKYTLIGANNLLRATLELPINFGVEGEFTVDKVIFEPASSGTLGLAASVPPTTHAEEAVATPSPLTSIVNDTHESLLLELVDLATPVFASLRIERADAKGPAQDQFRINGTMHLGPESDGVDVSAEPVVVNIGAFRQMIPAGLFNCRNEHEKSICHFLGSLGGITSMVTTTIDREVRFQVIADHLNLTGLDLQKSISFSLQIKDDLGVTHISSENLFGNDDEDPDSSTR